MFVQVSGKLRFNKKFSLAGTNGVTTIMILILIILGNTLEFEHVNPG
jgi:hypothetical protein